MKATGNANVFPVVCVGGSAGGLDAYTRLLKNLPADMGVAIVIVKHLRTVSVVAIQLRVRRRHTQLCSRMMRETFLWLMVQASRLS